VAHHQEEQVAHPEAVTFPTASYRVATGSRVDSGELSIPPERIDPLLPPPRLGFVEPAAVMIPTHAVDVFAPVSPQRGQLGDDFLAFGVIRQAVMSTGHIADV